MWLQKRRFVRVGAWALAHHLGARSALERPLFRPYVRQLVSHFETLPKEGEAYRQIHTTSSILEALGADFGIAVGSVPLEEQERVFNAPAIAATAPLPGMVGVVRALQGRVALGVASNTRSHQFIADAVERLGLADSFDPLVTSASCGVRKPGAAIFERVLDAWGIDPRQVVMVGDLPHKDVAGAKALGMRAIWLRTDVEPEKLGENDHGADGVAQTPNEVLTLLEGWMAR